VSERAPPSFLRQGSSLSLDGSPALLDDIVANGSATRAAASGGGLLVLESPTATPWVACTLDAVRSIDLIRLAIDRRLSGALEVRGTRGTRWLYFEEGAYAGSRSTHPEDSFGKILWREGRCRLDQVVIAFEDSKAKKARIGACLVDLGYLLKSEIRPFLRRQAEVVFEAVCLMTSGHAVFRTGLHHENPVRFFERTRSLLHATAESAGQHDMLLDRLRPLDRTCTAGAPPAVRLGEAETALVQLAASARKSPLTLQQLIDRSELGERLAVRALTTLIDESLLKVEQRDDADGGPPLVERLCKAINMTLAALDEHGFGLGDEVRAFAKSPPAGVSDALRALDLEEQLVVEGLLEKVQGAVFGATMPELEGALLAVIDHALFQARETLDESTATDIASAVNQLGVF
jgi:hypothetical protein